MPQNAGVFPANPVMPAPVASVLVSTYNQPDWLERCLWGYRCQDRHDFEAVIRRTAAERLSKPQEA